MAIRTVAAAIAALAITIASAYAASDAGKNDATAREIPAMHWQAGLIEAPASKITSRPGFLSVTDVEARRFRELADVVIPFAGLVAGVLGVKLTKAVGVGAFAVLAKKLGFLIVSPFAAAGAFFRRIFRRKPA
jgi:hypothetical protein